MTERIALIVPTTGTRGTLKRTVDSYLASVDFYNQQLSNTIPFIAWNGMDRSHLLRGTELPKEVELVPRVYVDHAADRAIGHLSAVFNRAVDATEERWAFFSADDDHVTIDHVSVCLRARSLATLATAILTQASGPDGHGQGWTIANSFLNIDRFRMVGWLTPSSGGEDFYTCSTLEVRGHQVVRDPHATWIVGLDVPSLTRDVRVEHEETVNSVQPANQTALADR